MATVFTVVGIMIAVFVKKVFIDTPEEGSGAEQHALLKVKPAGDEEAPIKRGVKATDSLV
eukprot:8919922-Pyramimonas_sp.AAC.1